MEIFMLIKDRLTISILQKLVETKTIQEIADEYKCSYIYIQKLLKQYKIACPYSSKKNTKTLIGQKYHYLTVISYKGINHRHDVLLNCRCDCGQFTEVKRTNLVNGNTKSCGCLAYEPRPNQTGENHYRWTGYKDIPGYFFTGILKGAQKRRLEFNITVEYIWSILEEQDFKCCLSSVPIGFTKNFRCRRDTTASLDRIDSFQGYIKGNVQWVHKRVNLIKHNMHQDELEYWISHLYETLQPSKISNKIYHTHLWGRRANKS